MAMLGQAAGRHLHALAHNRDPRHVEVGRRRRSIGAQRALGRGPRAAEDVDASVVALVDRVVGRMRAAHRVGRTVTLRLRFDDFSRATRSHTLDQATAHTPTVLGTARGLLADARPTIERKGLTLVGVAVANLDDDGAVQLALPFGRAAGGALDGALDGVRERFGTRSLTRAVLLGRDPGISVPLLAELTPVRRRAGRRSQHRPSLPRRPLPRRPAVSYPPAAEAAVDIPPVQPAGLGPPVGAGSRRAGEQGEKRCLRRTGCSTAPTIGGTWRA